MTTTAQRRRYYASIYRRDETPEHVSWLTLRLTPAQTRVLVAMVVLGPSLPGHVTKALMLVERRHPSYVTQVFASLDRMGLLLWTAGLAYPRPLLTKVLLEDRKHARIGMRTLKALQKVNLDDLRS